MFGFSDSRGKKFSAGNEPGFIYCSRTHFMALLTVSKELQSAIAETSALTVSVFPQV